MPDPGTTAGHRAVSKVFNVPELRIAVFSKLPALSILRAQRVCRSWYSTITLETKLQQRLFLSVGPGELIMPAIRGMCKQARRYASHTDSALMARPSQLFSLATAFGERLPRWRSVLSKAGYTSSPTPRARPKSSVPARPSRRARRSSSTRSSRHSGHKILPT